MKPFDRSLDADVQEELDRLEAALRGDADADPTLSALVEDVRAVRPTLGAEARERLEQRARAAATSRPHATPSRAGGALRQRRWRAALVVAMVAVAAVPVAGVVLREQQSGELASTADLSTIAPATRAETSPESGEDVVIEEQSLESRAPSDSAGDATTADSPQPEPAPSTGRTSPPRAAASGAVLGKDRSVIRDARQVVRVDRAAMTAAAGKVFGVVADQGGYVDTSSVSEVGSSPRSDFEIVVPSEHLDATITALGRIGKPVELDRSSADVTARRVSIADRLRDLRADRSSARLQLARATDAGDRAARRRELRLLSSRIARLEGEQRELRRQIATARLSLVLTTERESATTIPSDDDRWGLSTAWNDAGRVLEVIGGVLLIAVVVLIPLALVVGLVAVAIGRLVAGRKNRTIGEA